MVARGYGGQAPDIGYGFEITLEPPSGTSEAAPVEAGDLFKIAGTAFDSTGYKAAALTAADVPAAGDAAPGVVLVMAKHREIDPKGNLGCKVLGHFQTIRKLRYAGSAPAVGESIRVAAGGGNARRVEGVAYNGRSYILAVHTGTTEVEVLI